MSKILVIDDDDILREMVVTVLRGAGYIALEAENGSEGIDLARSDSPDLIICDILMGNVDGFSVLEQLRASESTATIPFVIMTSLSDRGSVRKGMTEGADDYLIKPFSLNDLLAAVQTQLAKHQRFIDTSEKMLSELRNNISMALPHEFLTPLHIILGNANVLMSDNSKLSSGDIMRIGSTIGRSGSRLQRLIENFLIYSQIEIIAANQSEIESLRNTQLPESLHLIDSIARQRARMYNRLSDITTELVESPIRLLPEHLTKIVEEIVDNALKFSESGTPIRVTSTKNANRLIISISDEGRGLSEKEIAYLGAYQQFKRKFYEQQGVGLGLIIAKRLTELYDGTMNIFSDGKKGTVVEIDLPAKSAQSESAGIRRKKE
ncbi:MAG: hybrid sensor histidine kinase/response regulator [Bacteroidota bacterium]